MSPIPDHLSRSYVARQVGTMVLSHVRADNPMALVRAASWFNLTSRIGLHFPLFVIHDLGCLLTTQPRTAEQIVGANNTLLAQISLSPTARIQLERYESLLQKLAASDVVSKLVGWRLRDELVAVLITRILTDTYHRWQDPVKTTGAKELPIDLGLYVDCAFAKHFKNFDPKPIWSFLDYLVEQELHIYTSTELIDLDTVRLLGLFRDDTAHGAESIGTALEVVDLFSTLDSPEANDIAAFTLDLLPSVLETKRASGSQTFAVDGYASLERKGNIDSLMLSELAYDDEIFEQKAMDQDLLYFGHEREREDERRLQYILVDSSASMRGRRQVFARGLALTLAKKLSLQGDEIWLRFFDSRLHDIVKVARSGAFSLPYLLSFRSERGRNYNKVFRQLLLEMARLKREQHRSTVVYIITHGQCHISPELVSALAQQAYLYGIIILPSSEVALEFLPLLHQHQIVDETTFHSRADRRDRALGIVEDAPSKETSNQDGKEGQL